MPQMSPLSWIILFNFFTSILVISTIIMNFSMLKKNNYNKNPSYKKMMNLKKFIMKW